MNTLRKIALWKRILAGIAVGLLIGYASPSAAVALSPLGDVFLRMLKMLIVPLVFFSITSVICEMGDVKQLHTVLNNVGDRSGTVIIAKRLGLMKTGVYNR